MHKAGLHPASFPPPSPPWPESSITSLENTSFTLLEMKGTEFQVSFYLKELTLKSSPRQELEVNGKELGRQGLLSTLVSNWVCAVLLEPHLAMCISLCPEVLPLGWSLYIPQECLRDVCTQIIIAMSPTPKMESCNSRGCNLRVPHSPLHRAPNRNLCSRWHQTLSMCMMAFLQLLGTVTGRVHCSLKPAWCLSCFVLF